MPNTEASDTAAAARDGAYRVGSPLSGLDEPIDDQQAFWNRWNSMFVEHRRGPTSQRQARIVKEWLARLYPDGADILEVGCGSGWMCELLASHGRVTGTDLSNEVLATVQARLPQVRFVAGDFMSLDLPDAGYDVVVTLETLPHMRDQAAFVRRLAQRLRPGGRLMLATQNRFVFERWEKVAPRARGQIRQWTTRRELRALLSSAFVVEELYTVSPFAHGGILRLVNSPRLNGLLAHAVPQARLDRWKEQAGLGHSIMALARRR